MPRYPRAFLPGIPLHIVQRGHDRQCVQRYQLTGDSRFKATIEARLGRRLSNKAQGRPRKD